MKPVEQKPGTGTGKLEKEAPGVDGEAAGVYVNYYDALRRYLLRRLGSVEDVDDMVQEVYLRAIQKHKPQFKPSISFLYKIASNLAKMRFRSKGARVQYIHIQVDDANLTAPTGSPEQDLRTKQGAAAINRILDGLKPMHRRAFLMHRVEGLTYEEIAKKLGMTKTQVKNQIYFVLVQIRLNIGDYLY